MPIRSTLLMISIALVVTISISTSQYTAAQDTPTPESPAYQILVTNSYGDYISLIDPQDGFMRTITVGSAPWGAVSGSDDRVYVATAEGIAVVDVVEQQRLALVPYQAAVRTDQFGEFRQGGMGITISPDGLYVYVGVYTGGQADQLEIMDTTTLTMVASVDIGSRPFDVVMSRDGRQVISIDHDSYSATVIDTTSLESQTIRVTPLGSGSFDKPHYATVGSDGQLWLPYQGRALVRFDPVAGTYTSSELTASTHQHGIAFSPDESQLLIVGTGPAGGVNGGPSLTIIDMQTMQETIVPLERPHEMVAVSPDGQWAYLTGGYSFTGGWDGLTIVNLQTLASVELAVPDAPLDIVIVESSTPA